MNAVTMEGIKAAITESAADNGAQCRIANPQEDKSLYEMAYDAVSHGDANVYMDEMSYDDFIKSAYLPAYITMDGQTLLVEAYIGTDGVEYCAALVKENGEESDMMEMVVNKPQAHGDMVDVFDSIIMGLN